MENYIMRTYWDYKTVLEVLEIMEFELVVSKNEDGKLVLKLIDWQAHLSSIEDEEFVDFDDLMSRLSGVFCYDYFECWITEEFENEIGDWKDYTDLYNQLMALPYERIKDWLWDINILGLFGYVYDEMGS